MSISRGVIAQLLQQSGKRAARQAGNTELSQGTAVPHRINQGGERVAYVCGIHGFTDFDHWALAPQAE